MNRVHHAALILCASLMLSACQKQAASYLIDGPNHSLTLYRTQPYFWSDYYEMELVVARLPDCQRRHKLRNVPLSQGSVELFQSLEGGYILRQGTQYYVTETDECRLEQYASPPREPGDPLGSFDTRDGGFTFISSQGSTVPASAAGG